MHEILFQGILFLDNQQRNQRRKEKKRKSKGKVKNQLIRSLEEDEVVENKERKAK